MRHIFMDESGDLGIGVGSQYFAMAFITPESGRRLNKIIKNFNAHLINNGWEKSLEIKASNLWHAPKNQSVPANFKYKNDPSVPLEYVLRKISGLDCRIEYVCVKLDTLRANLKAAPEGVLYNHFAWQLLRGPLCYFPAIELCADRRSRETHSLLKFDGYLETKAGIERAKKSKEPLTLKINHWHWKSPNEFKAEERGHVEFGVRGIEAADFTCWAIKRKFEDSESRWYELIEKRVKWKQHLYFTPETKSS